MNYTLTVADIASYLASTGWRREPETWRSASVWHTSDGQEVLLPARDGMGDGDLRVREILAVLARVESRSGTEIVEEIDSPFTDAQTYQLFSRTGPDNLASLPDGLRALTGVRQLLDSAGRAFVEGPHVTFGGAAPLTVQDLLARSQLRTTASNGFAFRVRIPVGLPNQGPDLLRGMMIQLHEAVGSAAVAASQPIETDDLSGFDDAVTAGVSANLCQALSSLSGQDRRQPFEISFTWAHRIPSHPAPGTIRFGVGSGARLADAARHLRRLKSSAEATVTGLIESLHDDEGRSDRWRVKVRGQVGLSQGVQPRRTLWVRLNDATAYDLAIAAHRERQVIRVRGIVGVVGSRLELAAGSGGFEISPDSG